MTRSAAGIAARPVMLALALSASVTAPVAQSAVVSREGWIVGEIRAFAVPSGPAEAARVIDELKGRGWLECDGRSHASAEYPALAAMLREIAASRTFRVPDLRGGAPLSAGHPLRYLIYAGSPATADKAGGAARLEAGLTLPPHYRLSAEVRLEGKNPKAAAVVDKDAAPSTKGGARVAAWILSPPGCGRDCEIARALDGDRAAGTITLQPCAAGTACRWTFENTGSAPRRFSFRFEAADAPGGRLQPLRLESSAVPTGPCVFVVWATQSRDEATPQAAERATVLVNVQSLQGACEPGSLKWN